MEQSTEVDPLQVVAQNANIPNEIASHNQRCTNELEGVEEAIVFFIGGAGDKESYYFNGPYNHAQKVQEIFDPWFKDLPPSGMYRSFYLGYNEVRGAKNIERNIINKITSLSSNVYIVGHSLGGWNGAHLSRILSDKNYKVKMLVSLDPVGEGVLVWLGSSIHRHKPEPIADYWINVLAKPTQPDQTDDIADFGERWLIANGPQINHTEDINHYDARGMFWAKVQGSQTVAQIMYFSIREAIWK